MFTKLLKNIIALVLFCLLGYFLFANFGGIWADLYTKYFPCKSPIVYTLGSFDTKFGISKKDFLADLSEAEKIWEKPAGRQLFTYSAEASATNVVKVNLVYDYRQEATVKIRNLGLAVSDTRASYDSLRVKYTLLEKDYAQDKLVYQSKVADFQSKQTAYQKKVDYWNSKGGAPKDEYNKLNAEADSLKQELKGIKQMEIDLNAQSDDINALVTVINNLARTLNINADQLNNIGASRGEEFTEGEYKEDITGREIDIYEFSTNEKLVRVLAHELGHSLGLDHVSDSKAIMYYLNENTTGELTAADLNEMKAVCKMK